MVLRAKAGEIKVPSTHTNLRGNISVTIEEFTKKSGDKGYRIIWKQEGEEDYIDTHFENFTEAWEQFLFLKESAMCDGEIPEDQVLVTNLYKIQEGYRHFTNGDDMKLVADRELGGLFSFL